MRVTIPKFDCMNSWSSVGPEAPLVDVPRRVVGHRAHAGAQQLAVAEHDLHPARRLEVLP